MVLGERFSAEISKKKVMFFWIFFPPEKPKMFAGEEVMTGGYETLPAKFLLNSFFSKLAPLTNYITDLVSSFNSASESVM